MSAKSAKTDGTKDVEHEMTDEELDKKTAAREGADRDGRAADATNPTDETKTETVEGTEPEDEDGTDTPEVSFSFTFDDEPDDLLPSDPAESDETEAVSGPETSDSAGSDADTDADDETVVPDETNSAATEANARRVNETIALAGDAMASGGHGDPNELRHAQARPDTEVDEQVADRVLLKSYPNFSLNHATTTNRRSGRHVLDNTSMAFYAGSLYAVRVQPDDQDPEERVTMMAVLGGFQAPTSGSAMTKSSNLIELEINELRGHRLGIVPQRFAVRGDLDAESNVLYAMNASGRTYLKPKPIAAREFLAKVGFGEATSGRKVKDLPLVEQRRVAIARAISCESDTLILDEPTKGLEASDARSILDLIVSIAHARDPKRAVIIVTASDEVAKRADEVYTLND
ncbi:ATP-binding cassette domain-containing protein [Bifidobacterium sp. MA2]|uniref:ATP-binding cassette domain-containing protein n=1 Tax=Bifidobacterium santillanense TaxID=2809028 RepID=A0ABS5UQK3_9BIFI|nr:ATP-binding cassette domain-containing protein [Bifidobacterium santillanense]MBT1173119.1 ATP-binding cassette domain-containing protein [Bifidobacterium santillanense]